jgi:hypothetical protein
MCVQAFQWGCSSWGGLMEMQLCWRQPQHMSGHTATCPQFLEMLHQLRSVTDAAVINGTDMQRAGTGPSVVLTGAVQS